jgi:hypothetical protein
MNPSSALYFPSLDQSEMSRELAAWRATWPECGALALLAEADRHALPALQAACRETGVALAGAIFPALLHDADFAAHGVWLLCLERMPATFLIADLNTQAEPAELIRAAVEDALDGTERPATLLLLFDAMVPNIGSILEALYLRLADRVRYMGANAGSETFQPMPCLFDGERLLANGVLGLLLDDDRGAVLEHGYLPPNELITATATAGNRIISIDWQPAFAVYREHVQALYGVDLTRDNFYQYGVHFPFGILLANGEVVVRIPVALEPDGSLFCVGEVPANSMLTLLQAPAVDSDYTVDKISRQLHDQFGVATGCDLLTFYCAGRRLHLGQAARPELGQLRRRSGCDQVVGALSLGEIGSLGEGRYPMFHNATLVCRPWQFSGGRNSE